MSLQNRLLDLTTRIATECKSIRTLVNGNQGDLSALTTANKTSLVQALNEIKALADSATSASAASVQINDATTSTQSVWSSSKVSNQIDTAVSALVNGAPGVLDTLEELAAALGNDQNFAATISTALAARVRVDVSSQGLSDLERTNARTNIGAVGVAQIGDTETNFVSTFNAGLN
jgi:hypothetical protein